MLWLELVSSEQVIRLSKVKSKRLSKDFPAFSKEHIYAYEPNAMNVFFFKKITRSTF